MGPPVFISKFKFLRDKQTIGRFEKASVQVRFQWNDLQGLVNISTNKIRVGLH